MDRNEALELLKTGVKNLGQTGAFQAYLEVSARFHNYSHMNRMMIAIQRPAATRVAGFNTWKDLGRFVRKGEKGIAIWAPLFFAKKDEEGNRTGEILRGFKVVHVFDVTQTDGKELPAPAAAQRLTGEEDGGIFEALVDFAQHGGLTVLPAFGAFEDERNGDYSPAYKTIRIRAGLAQLQRAKTMAHESAHWILHTDGLGGALPREVQETEAEAAAFLALARFGFRSDDYSFPYVAGWAGGDVAVLEASLARIEKAADEIIHAIEARVELMVEV